MKLLTKRIIMIGTMMAGIIFAGIPVFIADRTKATVYTYIGGAITLAGLVWGYVKIRCPHCGAGLPLRGHWLIEHCPLLRETIGKNLTEAAQAANMRFGIPGAFLRCWRKK